VKLPKIDRFGQKTTLDKAEHLCYDHSRRIRFHAFYRREGEKLMSKHPIVHVEFSAHDVHAAARFYADLFGWKTEHLPEMNYTTFEAEGGPGGGFNPVGEQVKAGDVFVYVATDDIEATLAKAESLGGKTIVPKTEIPHVGWFAFFADPTGNTVGLFTGMGEQS
jgi:predicted enzyme related to lactoylglutathione lyase